MKNIKIVAPSSYVPGLTADKINALKVFFNKLKYNINYERYLFEKKYFLAGKDSDRLSDLMAGFLDKKSADLKKSAKIILN